MAENLIKKIIRLICRKYLNNYFKFDSYLKRIIFKTFYIYVLGSVKGAENIQIYQWVSIKGPGKIYIGRNVRFGYHLSPSFHKGQIEIITKFDSSVLKIGTNCTINNNNKFVVVNNIELKEDCKTGHDVQFFDSDLHSTDIQLRHSGGDRDGKHGDIKLEKNVMVGGLVAIGPATYIGENSVVGMGSMLKRRKFPKNSIIVGNPGRAVRPI